MESRAPLQTGGGRKIASYAISVLMTRIAAALLILLTACTSSVSADMGPPPVKETDGETAMNLNIQIGRFGAINDQSRRAIEFLTEKAPPQTKIDDEVLYTTRDLYRRLYRSVVELNLIIVDGCHAGYLVDEQCNTLWRDWLKFPGQESYSLTQIQTYADDIQDAHVFIWTALCDKAKAKGADEYFCAME